MGRSNWLRIASVAGLAGVSLLSACTIGPSAGIGGAAVTVLLLVLLAGGTATTQTGCKGVGVEPCLTPALDGTVDPDTGESDTTGRDATDTETGRDTRVGPCLTAPLDTGRDTGTDPDATDVEPTDVEPTDVEPTDGDGQTDGDGETDGSSSDTAAPNDVDAQEGDTEVGARRDSERSEVIAKLRDRLPDDVADRLEDDKNA